MGAVVVGYLASPEGEAAIRQGIVEAKLRSVDLVVVYSQHSSHDDQTDHGQALDRARYLLADSNVAYEIVHITEGNDPVHDVLQAAEDVSAELIVIGIRRRSPVGKLVLGSHSQSILLEAAIPVLAVKA